MKRLHRVSLPVDLFLTVVGMLGIVLVVVFAVSTFAVAAGDTAKVSQVLPVNAESIRWTDSPTGYYHDSPTSLAFVVEGKTILELRRGVSYRITGGDVDGCYELVGGGYATTLASTECTKVK